MLHIFRSKMLKHNASPRVIFEGAFTDVYIDITDRISDIEQLLKTSGDFQFGNELNPNKAKLTEMLMDLCKKLDSYGTDSQKFVSQITKANPNITFGEVLNRVKAEFI